MELGLLEWGDERGICSLDEAKRNQGLFNELEIPNINPLDSVARL